MSACVRTTVLTLLVVGCLQPLESQSTSPHFIVSGTSTVRSWSCPADGTTKVVAGTTAPPVAGFAHGIQSVEVVVPVKAIACEDATMVEHLRQAMNEKTFPQIVYRLDHYELIGAETAKTTGTLTIGSVTKPVAFDMQLAPSPPGLRVRGETTVDLTQYGITPPVIFEGLLKVGKDVRIRFDAPLQP